MDEGGKPTSIGTGDAREAANSPVELKTPLQVPAAKPTRRVPLETGPLPVDAIKAAIGLELAPGPVFFSSRAQDHTEKGHPKEFALCVKHLPRIVADPDYIGRGPHQAEGFELIGEAQIDGALLLVAIKIHPDQRGRYIVASAYAIDRNKLNRRLRKGFLVQTSNRKSPAQVRGS